MSKAVSNVLCRCDARFDSHIKLGTYYNEALNCHSVIDYFLVSDKNIVNAIEVMDPDITSQITDQLLPAFNVSSVVVKVRSPAVQLGLLMSCAGIMLIWPYIVHLLVTTYSSYLLTLDIDRIYKFVVDSLRVSADSVIPKYSKNFFQYWWDNELDVLKEKSMDSCRLWKAAKNRDLVRYLTDIG